MVWLLAFVVLSGQEWLQVGARPISANECQTVQILVQHTPVLVLCADDKNADIQRLLPGHNHSAHAVRDVRPRGTFPPSGVQALP